MLEIARSTSQIVLLEHHSRHSVAILVIFYLCTRGVAQCSSVAPTIKPYVSGICEPEVVLTWLPLVLFLEQDKDHQLPVSAWILQEDCWFLVMKTVLVSCMISEEEEISSALSHTLLMLDQSDSLHRRIICCRVATITNWFLQIYKVSRLCSKRQSGDYIALILLLQK